MNKKIIASCVLLALAVLPGLALATEPIDPATWFIGVANRLLNIVVWPIFFAISVIMFIWAGFLFLTAKGEPGKIDTAKKAIVWAIVGIAVAIAGFSATTIITNVLGV